MARVRLPFLPEWRPLVLAGGKTTTVRTRRYGEPGDTFEVEGVAFRLARVEAMPLARARDACWAVEGFDAAEAFEAHWARLHPARGFRGSDTVWVHAFARAGEDADGRSRPRAP